MSITTSTTVVRTMACVVCGRRVTSGKRGRTREMHPECKPLQDALVRLDKALAGLGDLDMTPEALVDLRYRLFCATSEVPRPRDSRGRFLKRRG